MITSLRLGNFKAFVEMQEIPSVRSRLVLNSSGKTSIIHRLKRLLLIDKPTLDIGRRRNFVTRSTHRHRDMSLGYKSHREVTALLRSYAAYKVQPVVRL
jgi:hypothetical protein